MYLFLSTIYMWWCCDCYYLYYLYLYFLQATDVPSTFIVVKGLSPLVVDDQVSLPAAIVLSVSTVCYVCVCTILHVLYIVHYCKSAYYVLYEPH